MAENTIAAGNSALAPRRWMCLMPIIFVTYSLAYLDRVNYGFGAAGGLAKTLGISGSSSALFSLPSLLSAMFFLVPSHCRRLHVRSLWSVLRHYPRGNPTQCFGRGDGVD